MEDHTVANVLKIILTVLLPPVGLWFYTGFTTPFWLCLLLTLLGYLPGLVYAVYVISKPEMHSL